MSCFNLSGNMIRFSVHWENCITICMLMKQISMQFFCIFCKVFTQRWQHDTEKCENQLTYHPTHQSRSLISRSNPQLPPCINTTGITLTLCVNSGPHGSGGSSTPQGLHHSGAWYRAFVTAPSRPRQAL